ncbi:P-loop NTPase fold protein [Gillisia sp. CAL575]|uniref:P-loop NTPase fold protein n=1 Tax=Gillisia sp. CAL575 TaxID=985255 RepID=UPI00039E1480|nr:P-loop NTPase fold protein [Gillisia sp. CAL575]
MIFKELSITNESSRFHEHLSSQENDRIILSGIFGLGKTYFINKFFQDKEDEYISIKLNPVNYSVSGNQDIFELIKFDIGFQLFSLNPEFEKVEMGTFLAGQYYLIENYREVIKNLTKNLSKLDHRLNVIVNPAIELGEKIDQFKKERSIDDEKELKSFLEFFKLKKGTFREEDSITELIHYLVQTVKSNNPNKKIVLTIDDLDRIDPEHIFRILNVFSTHFDFYDYEGENKFGFDKVILICDIANIREIFRSRYGSNIDFSGYIDKFYSTEIFHYSFSSIIVENLKKFFKSIKTNHSIIQDYFQSGHENIYTNELEFILNHFVTANCLSTRALVNFLNKEYKFPNYTLETDDRAKIYSTETPILGTLDLLENLMGGSEELLKALEKTIERYPRKEFSPYQSFWDARIGNLIMLIDNEENNFDLSGENRIYQSEKYNIRVAYKIQPSSSHYGAYARATRIGHHNDEFTGEETIDFHQSITKRKLPYFQLLRDAYLNKLSFITNLR